MRAICTGLLRDRQEAEDAAQQVFLSALRSLHNGTVPRDPGAWLATISRRECWARARRPAVAALHAGLHDVKAEGPSTSAVSRAELEETWQAVAALPGRQREALLLREVRGLGYDELAEDMQLSRPSVRSLLTRARRTVRSQLQRGAAVLTGGPWLNMFPRLFGDGSNRPGVPRARAVARPENDAPWDRCAEGRSGHAGREWAHGRPDPSRSRRLASTSDHGGLKSGDVAQFGIRFNDDDEAFEDGQPVQVGQANTAEIEGTIVSLSPFVVSLEGLPLTITVPAGMTLPADLAVGQEIELTVQVGSGNTFTLVAIDEVENDQGEDSGGD